jgi:hypothetical protein
MNGKHHHQAIYKNSVYLVGDLVAFSAEDEVKSTLCIVHIPERAKCHFVTIMFGLRNSSADVLHDEI